MQVPVVVTCSTSTLTIRVQILLKSTIAWKERKWPVNRTFLKKALTVLGSDVNLDWKIKRPISVPLCHSLTPISPSLLDVVKDVRVSCNSEDITVTLATFGEEFNGLIYPKGLSKNSTCMMEYSHVDGTSVKYSLPLRSCNTMNIEVVSQAFGFVLKAQADATQSAASQISTLMKKVSWLRNRYSRIFSYFPQCSCLHLVWISLYLYLCLRFCSVFLWLSIR